MGGAQTREGGRSISANALERDVWGCFGIEPNYGRNYMAVLAQEIKRSRILS